jgi:hypothetical protein
VGGTVHFSWFYHLGWEGRQQGRAGYVIFGYLNGLVFIMMEWL